MKLMMNGAVTMGTLDGANVEIFDAVGKDNIYIFGMNTGEVEELWRNGYDSKTFYRSSPVLQGVIDRLMKPIAGEDFSYITDYLLNASYGVSDPFMCLADFESYINVYERAISDYGNTREWSKKSLMNTARSGIFSSDVSITNYANEIWHAKPVREYNK